MSKGLEALEKLNLIQKVFEKLAYWNGYDLSRLDEDYETNFDLDFCTIEKELKVLEIIKKHCELGTTIPLPNHKQFYDMLVSGLSKNEFNLIKEWLER